MGVATLDAHVFTIDPKSIQWRLKIKSSYDDTLGGRVVQVFGAEFEPMIVSGQFGSGGWQEQEAFLVKVKAMAVKQIGAPLRFTYPPRGWDFMVDLMDYSGDGGKSVEHTVGRFNPTWTLKLVIVDDNLDIKKVAIDSYLNRFSQGLGWHQSEFNGPVDMAQVKATLQKEGVSTIWDLIKKRTAAANTAQGGSESSTGASGPVAAGPLSVILETIKEVESGNDYTIQNPSPGATASGAYQFIDQTWNGYGGYPRAYLAPPAVQDERAAKDVQMFLAANNNDVSVIPVCWYIGHVPNANEWDIVPYAGMNTLTPRQYQTKWMAVYNAKLAAS